ncbi:MAG: glycosyltransferase family 2 protein [Clostridiales bacterium]|nr:glycosyltransferase family 2 protein [Clostridiales bacterium]
MKISIAIPCYKSKNTIADVVNEIIEKFAEKTKYSYQIILVNDYPNDSTFETIRELCKNNENIVGVNLSRNFGQSAAKMAAIPYCDGDVLVYMDDDGQHPAEYIFKLVDKIQEGYDAVYAYFPHKKHSVFKRLTSRINSKLLELNGTKPKGIHISSFYALSKFAVKAYQDYKSPFPSMGGYLNSIIDKSAEIELPHRDRISGTSNYTMFKLIKLFLTGFTNFSIVPLRIVTLIGILISFFGFIVGTYIIIRKLLVPSISAGYTSTLATMLFLGGLILFALGFIGEYIGRIYMTVSNLQQYKVREVLNYDKDVHT